MHRIDTDNDTAGTFTDGDPATGQLGTRLDADFYQDLQENVCRVIELAGMALAKGDGEQLYHAIVGIATGVAGGGAGAGSVPTTRVLGVGGLVTGGGDLTGDRTFTVAKASVADVAAGTRDDAAVTPAALAGALSTVAAGNSYVVKFPGGVMLQAGGYDAVAAEGVYNVVFPQPFATTNYRLSLAGQDASGSVNCDTWPQWVSKRTDGFTLMVQWTGISGTVRTLDSVDWHAIGV